MTRCGKSVASNLRSAAYMPGKLLRDGLNRRFAWPSRYSGVLMVALVTADHSLNAPARGLDAERAVAYAT